MLVRIDKNKRKNVCFSSSWICIYFSLLAHRVFIHFSLLATHLLNSNMHDYADQWCRVLHCKQCIPWYTWRLRDMCQVADREGSSNVVQKWGEQGGPQWRANKEEEGFSNGLCCYSCWCGLGMKTSFEDDVGDTCMFKINTFVVSWVRISRAQQRTILGPFQLGCIIYLLFIRPISKWCRWNGTFGLTEAVVARIP